MGSVGTARTRGIAAICLVAAAAVVVWGVLNVVMTPGAGQAASGHYVNPGTQLTKGEKASDKVAPLLVANFGALRGSNMGRDVRRSSSKLIVAGYPYLTGEMRQFMEPGDPSDQYMLDWTAATVEHDAFGPVLIVPGKLGICDLQQVHVNRSHIGVTSGCNNTVQVIRNHGMATMIDDGHGGQILFGITVDAARRAAVSTGRTRYTRFVTNNAYAYDVATGGKVTFHKATGRVARVVKATPFP